MAEDKTESLIGYDPLAWIKEDRTDEREITPAPLENSEDIAVMNLASSREDVESGQTASRDSEESDLFANRETPLAMASGRNSPAGVCTIQLEPVLNIRNVAVLHEQLLTALDSNNKLEIDASAVTFADTSTLQLLLILKRTAIGMQKDVVIDFPSEKFIEASDLLGLTEMLELNQAAAGLF